MQQRSPRTVIDVVHTRFFALTIHECRSKFLIPSSIIVGSLGVSGVMPALFSAMMFDAPGSEDNPATKLLFWLRMSS